MILCARVCMCDVSYIHYRIPGNLICEFVYN
jgi:hypothetical protein